MALRFRKRVRIAPGVRLNFSKSGISTTIGPRGASVNIGKKGTYLNAGIPGSGIYARERISGPKPKAVRPERPPAIERPKPSGSMGWVVALALFAILLIAFS